MASTAPMPPRTQIMLATQYGRYSTPAACSAFRTGPWVASAVWVSVSNTKRPFSTLLCQRLSAAEVGLLGQKDDELGLAFGGGVQDPGIDFGAPGVGRFLGRQGETAADDRQQHEEGDQRKCLTLHTSSLRECRHAQACR